jgi:hypothetical protein
MYPLYHPSYYGVYYSPPYIRYPLYYPSYPIYSPYRIAENQISTINQSLYNAGYMAGVTQAAYSNNIIY